MESLERSNIMYIIFYNNNYLINNICVVIATITMVTITIAALPYQQQHIYHNSNKYQRTTDPVTITSIIVLRLKVIDLYYYVFQFCYK